MIKQGSLNGRIYELLHNDWKLTNNDYYFSKIDYKTYKHFWGKDNEFYRIGVHLDQQLRLPKCVNPKKDNF